MKRIIMLFAVLASSCSSPTGGCGSTPCLTGCANRPAWCDYDAAVNDIGPADGTRG